MKREFIKYFILFSFTVFSIGCEKLVKETVYSDLAAENFIVTEAGIDMTLNAAYAASHFRSQVGEFRLMADVFSTGIAWGTRGNMGVTWATPWMNFTWTSTIERIPPQWSLCYLAIRDANIVLDNIDNELFSSEFKTRMAAEAKAIRGFAYYVLYSWFGTTPMHTTTKTTDLTLPRCTDEEMRNRIEQDLSEAAAALPVDQKQYGRTTKGGALGMLCKFYLNTKQWQKCVDAAQEIISLSKYQLLTNYADIFDINNQENKEILWARPSTNSESSCGNNLVALTYPMDYPLLPTQGNFVATVYVYDSFIDSFDENDTRGKLFIEQYANKSGVLMAGYGKNMSLFYKYPPDPAEVGTNDGRDLFELRYSDILLSLAEALNELNVPTTEVINLINQVRSRAGVTLISLADFNKNTLRDFIFKERRLELYFEAKEREDMLRQGTFISQAVARGINADDHHKLYPIPQVELDANPNLEPNPGY